MDSSAAQARAPGAPSSGCARLVPPAGAPCCQPGRSREWPRRRRRPTCSGEEPPKGVGTAWEWRFPTSRTGTGTRSASVPLRVGTTAPPSVTLFQDSPARGRRPHRGRTAELCSSASPPQLLLRGGAWGCPQPPKRVTPASATFPFRWLTLSRLGQRHDPGRQRRGGDWGSRRTREKSPLGPGGTKVLPCPGLKGPRAPLAQLPFLIQGLSATSVRAEQRSPAQDPAARRAALTTGGDRRGPRCRRLGRAGVRQRLAATTRTCRVPATPGPTYTNVLAFSWAQATHKGQGSRGRGPAK